MTLDKAVLLPGLINLHAHIELPPLLETIRAKTFPDWVLQLIQEKRKLSSADYTTAVRRNIDTLIRSGTTTVGEICTQGVSPACLKQGGLRAVIFHEIISMNPASPHPLRLSQRERPSSPLLKYGVSPHTPYTVSETVLSRIGQIARRKRLQMAMHVAESKEEIRLLQRQKSGIEKLYRFAGWDREWAPFADSPFAYLDRLDLLGSDFLAVHAVQASDRDLRLLRKSRTPVAHCPRSNKELGVGKMRLKKFLDAGIIVGLGTDSLASSPSLSMWDEMRYAYRVHRHEGVSARDIFELATLCGAKALGMGSEIGSLESGKRADIIAVPLPKKDTGDLYSDLLRETKSCIMTMVNGKVLHYQEAEQ